MAIVHEPTTQRDAADIRSGYNATGGTIARGTFCKLKTTPTVKGEIAKCAADTDYPLGVADRDIPNNEWGPVIIRGVVPVLGGAGVTAAGPVTSDGNGKAKDAGSGDAVMALARETGADGVLFECELVGPGGGRLLP